MTRHLRDPRPKSGRTAPSSPPRARSTPPGAPPNPLPPRRRAQKLATRLATPSDVAALVRSTMGNALDSEGIQLDEATVRCGVVALLADPSKGLAFVAYVPAPPEHGPRQPRAAHQGADAGGADAGGQILGSCYVTREWSDWHAKWYWWIQSVYVGPAHRRKGVYRALHQAVLAAAREQGVVRSIRLYVEESNRPALAAYANLGMTRTHYQVFEQSVRKGSSSQQGAQSPGPPTRRSRSPATSR